jgi:hypothetical protein
MLPGFWQQGGGVGSHLTAKGGEARGGEEEGGEEGQEEEVRGFTPV